MQIHFKLSFHLLFVIPMAAHVNCFASEKDINALYDPSKAEQQWLQEVLPQLIDWVKTQEDELISAGRKLTEQERVLAKKMGVKKPDLIRINVTAQFPSPTAQQLRDELKALRFDVKKLIGLTLGYAIVIHPDANNATRLLSHELVHVTQYERMGLENFLERYLLEIKRFGYAHAPLEMEAYEKQLK